jgi:ureidoglycolate hydrolase
MAPSGYADHSREAFVGATRVHVPVVENPDAEVFAPYGRFVAFDVNNLRRDVHTTDPEAELAHGEFLVRMESDVIHAKNNGIGSAEYTTALSAAASCDTHEWLVREVNNHPTSEQLFAPLEKQSFALLLAPSSIPRDALRPEDMRLFKFDGSASVVINVSTWHQPPYGSGRFYTAQAASHECEDVDFLDRDKAALVLSL